MIVGNLKSIEKELRYYPRGIQVGIQFLLSHDLMALQTGELYPIEGDKIFAKISEYDTNPKEERQAERHEKYIDIQCIAGGSEMIGAGLLDNVGNVTMDKMETNDAMKYADMQDDVIVTLTPGTFAIYFPWDIHRANCNPGLESVHVKKVLVKVAMDTLD
jgi:YhcH/YjgK/YiaL family protein